MASHFTRTELEKIVNGLIAKGLVFKIGDRYFAVPPWARAQPRDGIAIELAQ